MGDRGTSQGERFGDKVKECKEDSGCSEEGILNMEAKNTLKFTSTNHLLRTAGNPNVTNYRNWTN